MPDRSKWHCHVRPLHGDLANPLAEVIWCVDHYDGNDMWQEKDVFWSRAEALKQARRLRREWKEA